MASQFPGPQLRSLYRRILRELPSRQPTILANPSPIQQRIRSQFSTQPSSNMTLAEVKAALETTDQIVQYVKAQRMYTTLIERYNPGMNMNPEDRIKMTARRVGMDMPDEWVPGGGNKSGGDGSSGTTGGR